MNLFPCSWRLPSPRRELNPLKSLADHHFPRKTLRISAPVPDAVKEPVTIAIPECELCVGEQNDFSEVDRMLADLNDDSQNAKTRRMINTIQMIAANLEKNIRIIQDAPPSIENDNISRGNILTLLKGFLDFTKAIENHIKEITPSSSSFAQS